MSEATVEQNEYETFTTETSDEALEAAAGSRCFGAYTQFAYCTQFACPSLPRLEFAQQEG